MAKKRECPSCATLVPDNMDRCFICGYEFAGGPAHRRWRRWVALALLIVFLYPLIRLVLHALN